jgi:hypothetical protein
MPLSYKRGTPAPPRKSQFYHSKKGPASSQQKNINVFASKDADIDSEEIDDFEFDDEKYEESKESESNAPISRKERGGAGKKGSFFGRSLEDYVYTEDNDMQHVELRDS